MVLICPGRMTQTHSQFLADKEELSGLDVMVLDAAAAQLAYESKCGTITLCTNEKYLLEVHKLLSMGSATSLIESIWTDKAKFDRGQNISYVEDRLKWLNFRSARRNTSGWSWTDVATYYCLLAQGGFNYHFDKWSLRIDKGNPVHPDLEQIWQFSNAVRKHTLRYRRRTIYNFPIHEVDKDRTLIYIHIPIRFSQYGCGYAWTRRKLDFVRSQLVELADLGYKVCVSSLHTRWGREIEGAQNLLPSPLFHPHIYTSLKEPSRYGLNNLSKEVYYAAGV